MNRVLVVVSDELLSELDSARHETPRSAWIRRAVEERLAKEVPLVGSKRKHYFAGVEYEMPVEATGPLVPDWRKGEFIEEVAPMTDEDWKAFQEGAGFETPEETAILDWTHGITPEATVGQIADAIEAERAKPKARRKNVRKVPDQPVSVMNRGGGIAATQEPSSKPRKPKICQHSNTIRKLGQPFCTDCGEFV